MKLSRQLYLSFLSEDQRIGSVHKVSHGYLLDLIKQIEELEDKAQKWDKAETSLRWSPMCGESAATNR